MPREAQRLFACISPGPGCPVGERAAHQAGLEALAAAVREQASTACAQRVCLRPVRELHWGLKVPAYDRFAGTHLRAAYR